MKHVSFFRNLFWQYGLQMLKYLFPLVLIPYLTRVLGTSAYAVYAYTFSYMSIMQVIADFGFNLSGTKKVADCRHDKSLLGRLVGNITCARLLLIAGLFLVTLLISHLIPIMEANTLYVTLALAAVALKALLPDFVFQGFEHMGPLTTRYFASKGMQVLLTLLMVHSADDLLLVAVADIAGSLVALVWSLWAAHRMFGIRVRKPSIRKSITELCDSAIYCVSNVSSSLLSGFTTIIVGLAITDSTELAYWSLTLTTVNAVQALYTPITNSLYPHMLNSKDFGFARKLAILALPALFLGTGAYVILAEPIMLLLGGEEYIEATHAMRMISPVLVFSFYSMLIGWPVIGAMGFVGKLTATTLVTAGVNVVVMLGLYVSGMASLDTICIARWVADAILAGTRIITLLSIVKNDKREESYGLPRN